MGTIVFPSLLMIPHLSLSLTLAKFPSKDLITSYLGCSTISPFVLINPILSPCLIKAIPSSKS